MAELVGIKETKEALIGVNELAIVLAKHLKDGAQVSDALALVEDFKSNPELLAKIMAAKDGIAHVPSEVKDLSFAEGVELAIIQAQYVPKVLEAFKKV